MYKKMIVAVLVISGILFVLSPFIKESIIINLNKNKNFDLTAEQAEQNNAQKASFDFEAIQPPSILETIKASLDRESKAVIGRITISSVNLKLPILKGTTNQNLLYGATTMRPDQKMGEGNYPLAGHHMKRESLLFGPLLNIEKGDTVKITDFKKDYIYAVTSKQFISEMDTDVIQETKEKEITLMTCDKAVRTEGRLAVKGKLIHVAVHR
ncbi:class A sortase [Bacillus sp. FSL K6-1109]|jgi:sortase A|uniref:Class A sortase n=1 Tax=Bacillus licheniformis TaxID=1402 RepID=A0AB37GS05_BACLI|nr:class A sortase [Bacillus licheniformis]MDP4168633.1 class A sortase [Bacillota bacterium]ARC71008.1 sortase family protein [Bacillus licheniformis]ARC76536.1 sortase family protein [Bacillus licheniformis]ARW45697.1 Sortase A [Bacillus licheniformis]ARW52630.1 Sortase A [Bacillus licheniformis]